MSSVSPTASSWRRILAKSMARSPNDGAHSDHGPEITAIVGTRRLWKAVPPPKLQLAGARSLSGCRCALPKANSTVLARHLRGRPAR
jgi:hypothetical protein